MMNKELVTEKVKEILYAYGLFEDSLPVGSYNNVKDSFLETEQAQELIAGLSGEDWISVEKPPDIGDEYLVVYDLEDGDEPLTTAMQFDSRENKWYDERGAGTECKTVLFWMPLPEPPKP